MYSCWFTGNDIFSTESSSNGIQDMDEASVKGSLFIFPSRQYSYYRIHIIVKYIFFPCPAQYRLTNYTVYSINHEQGILEVLSTTIEKKIEKTFMIGFNFIWHQKNVTLPLRLLCICLSRLEFFTVILCHSQFTILP